MHLQHHQAPEHSLCSSYFLGFLVLGFATNHSDGFLRELYDRSKSSPSGNLNKSAAQVSDDAPILSSWFLVNITSGWAKWKSGSIFRCHWHCEPLTIAHLTWTGSEPVGRQWWSWLQNDNYMVLGCTGAWLLWKNGRKHKFKLSISRLSPAGPPQPAISNPLAPEGRGQREKRDYVGKVPKWRKKSNQKK